MWTLTLIPLLFSVVLSVHSKGNFSKGVFSFICFTYVIVFTAIYGGRDMFSGADSYIYATTYEIIGSGTRWEIGFYSWMELLRYFSGNYQFFFIITSLVQCLLIVISAALIRREFNNLYSLIFLLLFFYSFTAFDLFTSAMRQGLALSIAVLSLTLYLRGKVFISFVLLLMASLIHYSFSIIVLFYFIWLLFYRLKNKLQVLSVCLVTFFVLFLMPYNFDIYDWGSYYLKIYSPSDFLSSKIFLYNESLVGSYFSLNFIGKIFLWIYFVPVFILGCLNPNHYIRNLKVDFRFFTIGSLFVFLVYFVFSGQAYSYRYLYLLSAFYPVLMLILIRVFCLRFSVFNEYIAFFISALLVGVNYIYFVLIKSELTGFDYII